MCLGEMKWLHFFKVWEEAYVKVRSQKGDEKMEGVVLENKHFWKLLAELPDLQTQQPTV